jgi:hypothetical protein
MNDETEKQIDEYYNTLLWMIAETYVNPHVFCAAAAKIIHEVMEADLEDDIESYDE